MRRTIISIISFCAALIVVAQGVATPPVTLTIDSDDALKSWTQIKVDGSDSRQFSYNSSKGGAFIDEDRTKAIDHWLISSALDLEAGVNYKIILNCKKGSTYGTDYSKFSINVGTAATIDGQATELYENENFSEKEFTDVAAVFTPEASGTYYIGIHCYNVAYKGGFVVKSLAVDKVVPRPAAVSGLAIAAAPEGAMQATLTWTWPDMTDLGGELDQISGAYIYRGTSSTFTANESSLVGTYTVGATPGTAAEWTDTTVPSAGKYYYRVVPFNDNGASTSATTAVQSPWIGPDSGLGKVTNVAASPSADSETSVLLTFDAPKGANGGYVDISGVTYKITRKAESASATVTLEDSWNGTQPYVDSTIPGLDKYTYTVYVVNNGTASYSGSASNTIVTGGNAALPYSQDFSSTTSLSLFTIFHGAGATRDWDRSSSALRYWGSPADAWAAMPKFHLEAGKAYKLSFKTRIGSSGSNNYKDLQVYYGKAATAEALTSQIFSETIQSTTPAAKEVVFGVQTTGAYYVAFRCSASSSSNDLFVDDITLEEVEVKPQPVTGFKAEPAPDGALKVAFSWTNPSKDILNADLASIEKVEVLLDNAVVATVAAPAPGSESTAETTVAAPGIYTFCAVPYSGGFAGDTVTAKTAWVGNDVPVAPTNVKATDTEAGRVITFDAVTDGVNGGYIDAAAVRYTIKRDETVLAEDVAETSYTDTETDLPLAKYVYSVSAQCNGQTGAEGKTDAIIFGTGLGLPYTEGFSSTSALDFYTIFHGEGVSDDWERYSSALSYSGNTKDDAWAVLPKFKLQAGKAYQLSFTTWVASASYPKNLSVYTGTAPTAEGLTNKVFEESITSTSTYSSTAKKSMIISVPADGEYYVAFRCYGSSDYRRLYVDDVKFEELDVQPLAVTDVKAVAAPEGELKVTLSWTNPSKTNANTDITTLDKVEVLNGTDVVATVDAPAAGSTSSTDVTVEAAGEYSFTIVPYLNSIAGEAAKADVAWVGPDTPAAPQNVAVADTEAGRVISYDAVTTGVNGGYIDAAAVHYTIKRNDDIIAVNVTETSFTDTETDLPLAKYTYAVKAVCNDDESEFTSAPAIALGAALSLPYKADFTDKATFDLWSFSLNTSGNPAWTYSSKEEYLSTLSSSWAFTPPFTAYQGTAKVSFKATKCYNFDTAKIEVYLCTSTDVEAKAAPTLIAEFEPTGISYPDVQQHTFDVPADGKYYIGYHTATSDGGRLWQSDIEQLTATGIGAVGTPDGVVFGPDGSLSFDGEGTLTLYSLSGAAVWSQATDGGTLRPEVVAGLYVAAWQAADGTTMKFKYLAK